MPLIVDGSNRDPVLGPPGSPILILEREYKQITLCAGAVIVEDIVIGVDEEGKLKLISGVIGPVKRDENPTKGQDGILPDSPW